MEKKNDLSKKNQTEEVKSAAENSGMPFNVEEILNRRGERSREITTWLKADEERQREATRKIATQSRKALRKFRPSAVPRTVQKRSSYLVNHRMLAERLAVLRKENLSRLKNTKNVKKGTITISEEKAAELGLEIGKTVKISLRELAKIQNKQQNAGEKSIEIRLARMQQRRERDKKLVDTLYKQYMRMFKDLA